MERPLLIPIGAETLCGILYLPGGRIARGLVMCHPLFEERKSAHRIMVEAARAFAAAGCAVLRFDYRGCGDSSGEFAAFSCPEWKADIARAAACLADETGAAPIGLLGLRLGASLAIEVAAALGPRSAQASPPGGEVGPASTGSGEGCVTPIRFLVLWEPVLSGRRYLDQELRRKLVKEMVTFGQSRVTRAALMRDIEEGKPVDLDGYPLTPRLVADLNAIHLPDAARRVACRTLLVPVSPSPDPSREFLDLRDTLASAGAATDLVAAAEDPFWNLVGLVSCPTLIAKTEAWLAGQAEHVTGDVAGRSR